MSDALKRLTGRNKYLLGEIESLRTDPWRIPEEEIPRGWSFYVLNYDVLQPPVSQWFCALRDDYGDTHTGYGSSPRAAVLNAILSRART